MQGCISNCRICGAGWGDGLFCKPCAFAHGYKRRSATRFSVNAICHILFIAVTMLSDLRHSSK